MSRERDKAIAEWLGWTDSGRKTSLGDIVWLSPRGLTATSLPHYADPDQTGPLLEALLRKGWHVDLGILGGQYYVSLSRLNECIPVGEAPTLAAAVAELAYKIAGGQG